ncbi:MAG: TerC family protein [Planctomycetia bacterium]
MSVFWVYAGFFALVLVALALDLGVFHRTPHEVKAREALTWTGIWALVAVLFSGVVWLLYENHVCGLGICAPDPSLGGTDAALLYLQGWIVEQSLSVDNMFVIALVFGHFKVPALYQHRVLVWGVLGALVMRGTLIALGATLVQSFNWTSYIFGGFLLFTAAKMLVDKGEDEVHPDKAWLIRVARRIYPVSTDYDGQRFFTRRHDGVRAMTPLFLVLLAVEFTDLVFAVDSIPAIFSITTDPFLVITSNVFAIRGLRSLFFAVHDLMGRLHYMKLTLVVLLALIGAKMIVEKALAWHPPAWVSLAAIVGVLAVGVVASLVRTRASRHASA